MTKKRTDGAGNIAQLPSGSWRGQVMAGYRPDGKKNIISFTAPTKDEVQKMIQCYRLCRDQLPDDGTHSAEQKISFSNWADSWYEDYKTQVEPSTYSNYKYTLRILKDYFGSWPIEDIRVIDINRFHSFLVQESLSKSYISKCRAMLMQIFDFAEANELIRSNPARKSKAVRIRTSFSENETDSKKDAFTDWEQQQLKQHLPDNLAGHTIRVMLGTGTRTQEILALYPSDIADDGSTITINKAIKTVNGAPELGPPKSAKGRRIIPVPEDYRADALFLKQHSGKPYVWTSNRSNGLYDIGTFRRRYYKELRKIPGVRPLSPHCCRHTYITTLEKLGVPMEQIARLAGHAHVGTSDQYLHLDTSTLEKAVSVLNRTAP